MARPSRANTCQKQMPSKPGIALRRRINFSRPE
jgi:hypothetical protein